ncbi:hypothetical protein A2773_01230 [Candidatus Gottesmanbacteria bacterium RIFCSPHIGHO2_01_FULL_39_10]|uniref:TrbC/VIRB2 family protein n=1 Tax=Candidatus Gottesmanbacteria bacterium RIFCSPHIGHO2_01_FULL_39_10 TaxID=1798375 RepID=A0A1F5ZR65_9BACT|nr:MAG: hypothetical protein A2773_01230 [Candidatus Gottesmanbacteria bacterium RIFCSPHIGHO2_01_FULL_39_10]
MLVEKAWAACDVSSGSVDIAECFAPAKTFTSLGHLVGVLSQNFILIGGIIFFVLVFIAGFGMIQGAGSEDSKQMEKGKMMFTYAIIGFAIIFGAYWIVQIVNMITNGALGGIFQ